MRPLKEKVSITLDSDLVAKVKVFSEKDDRSFSQYINMAVKDYISRVAQDSDHVNSKQS